jgi:hypothetical protein
MEAGEGSPAFSVLSFSSQFSVLSSQFSVLSKGKTDLTRFVNLKLQI